MIDNLKKRFPVFTKNPNLVFLDPPYRQNLGSYALQSAVQNRWIAPEALIVWEESRPRNAFMDFEVLDRRQFRDIFVTILRAPKALLQ